MKRTLFVRSRLPHDQGFTLIELVVVLLLVGILAVVALPRMLDAHAFEARTYADRLQAAVTYAHKIAMAQRRPVEITFTESGASIAYVSGPTINLPIVNPKTNTSFDLTCPSSIPNCLTPNASVVFNVNNSGKTQTSTGSALNIVVSGSGHSTTFIVENTTGHVWTP